MNRPCCPHCQRPAVVANSHASGSIRVKVFGCVRCGEYGLGKFIVASNEIRTRAVIGNNVRDPSGRFAVTR